MEKYFLLILFVLNSMNIFAEEDSTKDQNQIFYGILSDIEKLSLEDFSTDLRALETRMDKYIDFQKRVCTGEFSALVMKGLETGVSEKVDLGESEGSLSRKEKELCLNNLIENQKSYISVVFKKRRDFAKFLYEKRLENLKSLEESYIADLNISRTSKTSKRNQRKRR